LSKLVLVLAGLVKVEISETNVLEHKLLFSVNVKLTNVSSYGIKIPLKKRCHSFKAKFRISETFTICVKRNNLIVL
jgi:hypothetical protein